MTQEQSPTIEQSRDAGVQMEGNTLVSMTSLLDDENPITEVEAGVSRGNLIRSAENGVIVTGNSRFLVMSSVIDLNIDANS